MKGLILLFLAFKMRLQNYPFSVLNNNKIVNAFFVEFSVEISLFRSHNPNNPNISICLSIFCQDKRKSYYSSFHNTFTLIDAPLE